MYADSSGPEFQSAIELGCEMALPFPFLDVMLVKKLQIQLSSPGKLPIGQLISEANSLVLDSSKIRTENI